MNDPLVKPAFGACMCGAEGAFVVWDEPKMVGTFACSEHLWWIKKQLGGGGVERMEP